MRYLSLVLVIICSTTVESQSITPFKKGDRIAFVGNSITDGGHYHSYIWLYYITHFPTERIDVFNSGIGGDIAMQIYDRLETDVFAKKPNIISLTFGMNDTGYQEYLRANAKELSDAKVQQSLKSFSLIEEKLQLHSKSRKIMMASSPYDETSKIKTVAFPGKNKAMLRIADAQKASAEINHWEYIDLNTPLVTINKREQRTDTSFTLCGNDHIHPSNDGHFVMAWEFLSRQGMSGKKVADISIDASSKKIIRSENCRISGVASLPDGSISFNYLANSLPYPIDTISRGGSGGMNSRKQSDALKVIPFTQDFNSEMLSVTGLQPSAKYILKIDSIESGSFTGSELGGGINMALISKTPQYQQALSIMALNEERWEVERRLREYYWLHYSILTKKGLLFNDSESTYDSVKVYARRDVFVRGVINTYQKARFKEVREAWQREIDLLVNQIYIINKPRAHMISIRPQK